MRSPRILIVDDEADLRELLEITLVKMGLDVDSAETLAQARGFLARAEYALVLTDMRLPDGLGLELVREVSAAHKNTPIAVITAFGSADNAVIALKAGAFDYVSKPVVLDELRVMVQSALRLNAPPSRPGAAGGAGSGAGVVAPGRPRLRGESAVIQALRAQIARLARSMAPIAITGESGSGKELAAREIHAMSSRAEQAFIAVNCGAIPEALMEAEFFGYRKGAFTGASDERDGFFQAANGGTLMLDEVADLPLAMQVKLLRAIQERRVRKIGATAEEPVDVRIISATHQDLAQCVERGKFRQDLFYRLSVIELSLPPLRERLDDLELLTNAILERFSSFEQRAVLGPGVLDALRAYAFPGNVRELENILERALAFADQGVIQVADLALKPVRLEAPAAGGARAPALVRNEALAGAAASGWPAAATQAAAATAGVPAAGWAGASFAAPPHAASMTTPAASPPAPPPMPAAPTRAAPAMQPALASQAIGALAPAPNRLPETLNQVERNIILQALAQSSNDPAAGALLLGVSVRQLRYQMQRLGIHAPET